MDSQDVIKIGHEAKRETEAFINRHINDSDKGWPKICLAGSAYTGYRQAQPVRKLEMRHTVPTK